MSSALRESPWKLRAEIAWARLLLGLVSVPGITTPKPEVHYFLFDRYFRLSEIHRSCGREGRAQRLRRVAEWHLERSGLRLPPTAQAHALQRPTRPTLTWSVAERPEPPDSAA